MGLIPADQRDLSLLRLNRPSLLFCTYSDAGFAPSSVRRACLRMSLLKDLTWKNAARNSMLQ
jgi:hypothetical protein